MKERLYLKFVETPHFIATREIRSISHRRCRRYLTIQSYDQV
jgi:hypothetical protein